MINLVTFLLWITNKIQLSAIMTRPIYQDITYGTALAATKHKSDFKLTTDTSYLTLKGELWGVCYENFEENWLWYNSTAL